MFQMFKVFHIIKIIKLSCSSRSCFLSDFFSIFFRILPTVYWQRPSWQRFMQFPIVCERTRIWTFWPNIPFSMKTQYTVRPPKSYSPELKILWRNECTIFSFSKMRYVENIFFLLYYGK